MGAARRSSPRGICASAINIGLDGRYAEFAGSVLASDVDIVLLTEPGHELEGKNRLARIGFDRVIGYLDQPDKVMFEHQDDVQVASRLTAKAFGERAAEMADLQIVDVRNPGEAAAGMIPGAINIPVGQLPDRLGELDATKPTVVYCAGGYRSSVAASLLRQRGFADVSDILGGYTAWEASRPERLSGHRKEKHHDHRQAPDSRRRRRHGRHHGRGPRAAQGLHRRRGHRAVEHALLPTAVDPCGRRPGQASMTARTESSVMPKGQREGAPTEASRGAYP